MESALQADRRLTRAEGDVGASDDDMSRAEGRGLFLGDGPASTEEGMSRTDGGKRFIAMAPRREGLSRADCRAPVGEGVTFTSEDLIGLCDAADLTGVKT